MWIHITARKNTNNKNTWGYFTCNFSCKGESVPCVAPCASCGQTWSPSGQYPWGPAPDSPRTRTRDLSPTSYPSSSFFYIMNLMKEIKFTLRLFRQKWKAAKLSYPIFAAACSGMIAFVTKKTSMQNKLKYTFLYTICISVYFCRLFSLLTARSDFCVCSAIVNVPGNVWFGP